MCLFLITGQLAQVQNRLFGAIKGGNLGEVNEVSEYFEALKDKNELTILHISDAFFCMEGDYACLEQVKAFDISVGAGMELKAESSYGERTYYLFTS